MQGIPPSPSTFIPYIYFASRLSPLSPGLQELKILIGLFDFRFN
jgi:hypothetical protein